MKKQKIMIGVLSLLLWLTSCDGIIEAATKATFLSAPRELTPDDLLHCPPDDSWGTTIVGEPELTAADLDAFVQSVNPGAPRIAQHYIQLGRLYGIRGDIAFAQSVLETGFFLYIPPGQNNFAGIGAVGGGELGHFFSTPSEGVRAQLEHLWAYATKQPLQNDPVDPRFAFVNRGCAPTWEALGGKWAVPGYNAYRFDNFAVAFSAGDTYGQRILKIYCEMKEYAKR